MGLAFAFTKKAEFPGYWALLPAFGAALFILSGPQALINRTLFPLKPVVAIGLISYPLYLWHWPLISFEYILIGARPANEHLWEAIGLSFVLSTLTYYFIEKPTRHLASGTSYRFILPLAMATAAGGLMIVGFSGFPERSAVTHFAVNEGETDHKVFHNYGNEKYFPCEASELRNNALSFNGTLRCHQTKPGTDYDIILLGDSHAEHLFYGLAEQLPAKNIVYAIHLGLPVPENKHVAPVYDYLLRNEKLKSRDLLLTAGWAYYPKDAHNWTGIRESVQRFQKAGYHVIITDDVPIFPFDARLCKFQRRFALQPQKCRERSQHMELANAQVQKNIESIVASTSVVLLRTSDIFREGDEYFMAKDGRLFYRDFNHLNVNGSLYLAQQLNDSGQLQVFGPKDPLP